MASIERRTRDGQTRRHARYRNPTGTQLVTVFTRKVDAERDLTTVEASKITGSYVDPKQGTRSFDDVAEQRRTAMAKNLAKIIPDVYRMCTETAPSGL